VNLVVGGAMNWGKMGVANFVGFPENHRKWRAGGRTRKEGVQGGKKRFKEA